VTSVAEVESAPRAREHGRAAEAPTEIPARGWKDVLLRVKQEAKDDQLTFLAGGVAFFALIALVPALIALVSLFGLIADPADVQQQVSDALAGAPAEVRDLVQTQLHDITQSSSAGLGIGVAVGVAVALWSASAGITNLMAALNRVYDENETRKFVKLRATALGLTLGAVIFVVVAVLAITVLPDGLLISLVRWPAIAVAYILVLAVIYRVGPDRADARWRWITPGAVAATGLMLLGSLAFSLYTSSFAKYNETYGALGAVVITMLWLELTAFAVLFGAELNAELEHQTAEDSTTGPEQPMGERGAEMADTVGATAEELKAAKDPR
jgi:membrane protein